MEIGISTDQMIDVGLNLAGFIVVGLLLMLIKSLFSRKRNTAPVQDVPQPPSITSVAVTSAREHILYTYDVEATDQPVNL